jgi:tripartite-type tricarboxylate transporter receptor subunit TctC
MRRTIGAVRRAFLGAALLSASVAASATAQQTPFYPDRPVQVIVSWQAGGVVDTIGRALSQAMSTWRRAASWW